MSQNPYAGYGGPEQGMDYGQPPRTSVLAVLSIVCSIISLAVCCIPGVGLFIGLVGILLGAVSLSLISKSRGRVEGKGAAIGGIILGVIGVALGAFVIFGVLQGYTFYVKKMVGTTDRFVQAIAADDFDAARAEMTEDAAARVADAQFEWFRAQIESKIGPIDSAATDPGTMFEAFGKVFENQGGQGQQGGTYQSNPNSGQVMVPVAIVGDNGYALAWPIMDTDELNAQTVKIVDIFVLFDDASLVTLRKDGPAAMNSKQMFEDRVTEGQPDDLPPPPEDDEGEDAGAPSGQDAENEPAGESEQATDGEPVGAIGPDRSERSAA